MVEMPSYTDSMRSANSMRAQNYSCWRVSAEIGQFKLVYRSCLLIFFFFCCLLYRFILCSHTYIWFPCVRGCCGLGTPGVIYYYVFGELHSDIALAKRQVHCVHPPVMSIYHRCENVRMFECLLQNAIFVGLEKWWSCGLQTECDRSILQPA